MMPKVSKPLNEVSDTASGASLLSDVWDVLDVLGADVLGEPSPDADVLLPVFDTMFKHSYLYSTLLPVFDTVPAYSYLYSTLLPV